MTARTGSPGALLGPLPPGLKVLGWLLAGGHAPARWLSPWRGCRPNGEAKSQSHQVCGVFGGGQRGAAKVEMAHTGKHTKKTPFKSILSLQHAGSVPQAFPETCSPDPRPKLSVWRFLLLPRLLLVGTNWEAKQEKKINKNLSLTVTYLLQMDLGT